MAKHERSFTAPETDVTGAGDERPMPSTGGAILSHGLGAGVTFTAFMLGKDAIEGTVPPWPRATLVYGFVLVFGGIVYGVLWWWLDRRWGRRGGR
jgi:hypothetical protein